MGTKDKAVAFSKKFKLDSHHTIERFGVFFGTLVLTGALVLLTSGFSAYMSGKDKLGDTTLWTPKFTTSKTALNGEVHGVYTNELKNRALVMMRFDQRAQISYNAADYEAFLLGSDEKLNSEKLQTAGVKGSLHVFGSTGYVGVLLEADEPFAQQVLNLTMRANAELSFNKQRADGASTEDVIGDKSFVRYDQWRVFVNPGATGAKHVAALDSAVVDPAQVYYQVVLKSNEDDARKALDDKLVEMRVNLAQIKAYGDDLATTKVDGMFLRPPKVPAIVDGDEVTGETAGESKDGTASLASSAKTVVPGGFDFDWRAGNVADGYLDQLVPKGQSYIKFLSDKTREDSSGSKASTSINDMQWVLSDGSNLTGDYQSSDVTMRPLMNVMNNLSQAYQGYYTNKSQYQSGLLLALLKLDVELRDVRSNSSTRTDDFLVTYF